MILNEMTNVDGGVKKSSSESAATCSRWFLARGFFYPEDGGDTFLRNVGSHKIYTAPHPRRRHSPSELSRIIATIIFRLFNATVSTAEVT
jgi:hypothetical protein